MRYGTTSNWLRRARAARGRCDTPWRCSARYAELRVNPGMLGRSPPTTSSRASGGLGGPRDAARGAARPHDFEYAGCARAAGRERPRLGGDGPATSLVTGHFTFGASSRSALLASLPAAIHVPAEAAARGPLGGVVSLIVSESAAAYPGGAIALARLADLLLVHALRAWTARPDAEECPLRAIADPSVGAALRLLHARPAEPWTVARLAAAVGASRSGLAARFTALVGVPPLHYLARWRMSTAARLLDEGQLGVAAVAARVGYANPVAFTKAFARIQGIGPGAFRRRARAGALPGARSDRPSTQPAARRRPAPLRVRAGP